MSLFNVAGAPGTPGVPETVRFPYQQQYGFRKDAEVLRYDWNINEKLNFFFRWADDSQRETQPLGIFATLPSPVFPQYRKKPGSSWSWNLVNVISPSTTNEVIFGYNRLTQVVDVTDEHRHVDSTTGPRSASRSRSCIRNRTSATGSRDSTAESARATTRASRRSGPATPASSP